MICELLFVTVLGLSPNAHSLQVVDTSATEAQSVRLLARATPSRFLALNPSRFTQVLVIGEADRALRSRWLIEPGGTLDERFPLDTLNGLSMEVLSVEDDGLHSSGALPIDPMTALGVVAVEVESSSDHTLVAWLHDSAGRWPFESNGSLLPNALPTRTPTASATSPRHAPVVTPDDKPLGNRPPPLEKQPLPPI